MFSNVSSHTARTIADSMGCCFSALTARCRKTRDADDATDTVEADAAEPDPESAPMTPRPSLPNEIWGEVASFCARQDILNLRSTCRHIKSEADTAVTTMTVRGSENLYDLADSSGFEHIKVLRLHAVDDASLYYFARALRVQHRTNLALAVSQSDIGTLSGAETLCAMPLAALTLVCAHNLNYHMLRALNACSFPITLVGQFSLVELASISGIPNLLRLDSESDTFNDEAANLLASHPMLRTLSIRAAQNLSPYGIRRIAATPKLSRLSLYESDYLSSRMTAEGAQALAACKTLTYLCIQTSVTPLTEESLCGLATSTSIKTLEVSIGPGLHHLAHIASLEALTLKGKCLGSSALDVVSARALAHMPRLQSLSIEFAQMAPGALATIVQGHPLRHLLLRHVSVTPDALSAIVGNYRLVTLALHAAEISAEQITAFALHPTLHTLRIDDADIPLQHIRRRTDEQVSGLGHILA